MPSILFVCLGNRCLSPLAVAIFWNRLCAWGRTEGRCRKREHLDSARLSVDPLAQKAVQEIGLDLRNHHTRSMNQIVLNKYDLIVMEKGHKETLNAKSPECDGKLHLLIHLAGGSEDVPDPSGKNLPFHLQTAMEMVRLISTAYTRICELAAI